MSNIGWKDVLSDEMPVDWAHEIDIFEGQMELMGQGKLNEKVFAETRLRRGCTASVTTMASGTTVLRVGSLDLRKTSASKGLKRSGMHLECSASKCLAVV